jgi:hypothetical protein
MKKIFTTLSVLCLATWCFGQQANDIIYKKNGTNEKCEIVKIDDTKIKFRIPENIDGPLYNVLRRDVALVVKGNGEFLLPESSASFSHGSDTNYDKIITADGRVIAATDLDLQNDVVTYQDPFAAAKAQIKKSDISVVFLKDGKHMMLADPSKTAQLLAQLSTKIAFVEQPKKSGELEPVQPPQPDHSKAVVPEKPVVTPGPTPVTNVANKAEKNIDHEAFSKKALKKTEDFSMYLKLITDKGTDYQDVNDAIDLATALFINEEARVEVSTVNNPKKASFKIRDYLMKLKLLKYDKVEITWADISYVSNFRLAPDGNYYATVSIQQTFKGFNENKVAYTDITEKYMEIVLKSYKKEVDGKIDDYWDVLLSDVGVINTRLN